MSGEVPNLTTAPEEPVIFIEPGGVHPPGTMINNFMAVPPQFVLSRRTFKAGGAEMFWLGSDSTPLDDDTSATWTLEPWFSVQREFPCRKSLKLSAPASVSEVAFPSWWGSIVWASRDVPLASSLALTNKSFHLFVGTLAPVHAESIFHVKHDTVLNEQSAYSVKSCPPKKGINIVALSPSKRTLVFLARARL